jgi:hypothetical protein
MGRTGSGISSEEELGAAVDHIEAALQLALSVEAGARNLALAHQALKKSRLPVPVKQAGDVHAPMAAALLELDRLRIRAERSGVPMEQWLEAVAEDIRAAAPSVDLIALEAVLTLAKRMAEDPRRSLGAQAHVRGGIVRALTG